MTHCQRVLALLSDGQPHTHHELYALNVIAHSRISDLRRRGHKIACWTSRVHGETVSVYQLVSLGEREPNSLPEVPFPEADANGFRSPSESRQLSVWEAA